MCMCVNGLQYASTFLICRSWTRIRELPPHCRPVLFKNRHPPRNGAMPAERAESGVGQLAASGDGK